VVLLVAVEEGVTGVVGDQVRLNNGSRFDDDYVLVNPAQGCSTDGNQLKGVAVKMNGMIVYAAIVKDQAVAKSFVQ
jgi:hypothetical protein